MRRREGTIITAERAENLLGASPRSLLASFTDAVAARNTVSALSVIDEVYGSSRDMAVFWRELISFLHRDILVAVGTKMARASDETIKRAARSVYLAKAVICHGDVYFRRRGYAEKNPSGARLYAEMAVIRACDSSLSQSPSALAERISAVEDSLARGAVYCGEDGKTRLRIRGIRTIAYKGKL